MKAKTYYPAVGKRYKIIHHDGYIVEVDRRTYRKVANLESCKEVIHNMYVCDLLVVVGKYDWMEK